MDIQLGLIGFPIEHSLSPWIHKQLLKQTHLIGDYQLLNLNTTTLTKQHIDFIKSHNLLGFNVTVPFKETIVPFLDHIDEYANNIGAVNTVLNQNGVLTGYNTDGIGYLRALENTYPFVSEDKSISILIIGAGGAAKGIHTALIDAGFGNIDIANRTVEHAKIIAKASHQRLATKCITLQQAESDLANYQLIIQTSSVGMKPNEDLKIINLKKLRQGTIVSDIVYQPLMTRFLTEAKQKGAHIHFGHTMLLHQAMYAFEIWTNKQVEAGELVDKLTEVLKGEVIMLTGKQKRHLRSLANYEKAIFQVGKSGVNENMTEQMNEALEKRELIKVSILQNCEESKEDVGDQLAKSTGAEIVQIIGFNIVLYKESQENKQINLP